MKRDFQNEYYESVYAFLSRETGAVRSDVEDLTQETLLRAWRARDSFRGESEEKTWVLSIARNLIRDRWRRRKETHLKDAVAALDTKPVPPELASTNEMRSLVRRALADLKEEHRALLIRRHVKGQTVPQMAREVGESVDAIESRLRRAQEAMKRRMQDDE